MLKLKVTAKEEESKCFKILKIRIEPAKIWSRTHPKYEQGIICKLLHVLTHMCGHTN